MDGRDGLYIGVAQSLALVPGVSRSGATISAGLFRGFDRVAAARYSFLLSVPAVVLSGLFELRKVGEAGSPSVGATVIATLVAFVTGYASIAWLLRYLGTHSLRVFVDLPHRPRRPGAGPDRHRRDQLSRCGSATNRPQKQRTARGSGPFAVTREEIS